MIQRPRVLISSILTAQFLCVVVVTLLYAGWQRAIWQDSLSGQLRELSIDVAAGAAEQLRERLQKYDPDTDGPRSQRLQAYVDQLVLPTGWRVRVIDEHGRAVTGTTPALTGPPTAGPPGDWRISGGFRPTRLQAQLAQQPDGFTGTIERPGRSVEVAVVPVAAWPFYVLAEHRVELGHLPLTGIVSPATAVGVAMGVLLVLLSGWVTVRIVRRYESELAGLNKSLEEKVFLRTSALVQTRDAVMYGLARLAESRDRETGDHVLRIQKLSALLARELRKTLPQIDEAWIERIRLAAALHDIGKVGIPDAILRKPGPLTAHERAVMQRHPQIGEECLTAISDRLGDNDFLEMAREIAGAHHEWWNGRGYPRGLRAEEIPLAARIVAVADVYDAATSARVYKDPKSPEAVRDLLVAYRGEQFDPLVINAFLAVEPQFQALCGSSSVVVPTDTSGSVAGAVPDGPAAALRVARAAAPVAF